MNHPRAGQGSPALAAMAIACALTTGVASAEWTQTAGPPGGMLNSPIGDGAQTIYASVTGNIFRSDAAVVTEPNATGGGWYYYPGVVLLRGISGGGGGAAADLNNDGAVNAADLALLLGAWGACASCAADLNSDRDVTPPTSRCCWEAGADRAELV